MSNLITFCGEMTGLVHEEGAVDVVYLDFSKAFSRACWKILRQKLITYELDEQTVRWWLVISGMKST